MGSQSVCISLMICYVDRRVVKLYLCLQSHHLIIRTRYAMILYFPEEFRYCQLIIYISIPNTQMLVNRNIVIIIDKQQHRKHTVKKKNNFQSVDNLIQLEQYFCWKPYLCCALP